MSYSQPRDRLELRLKEIIDNAIGDVTDRRTRFDTLLAAVVDPSVVPPDQRDRIELYLSELAGRAGGGVTPTGTVNITANGTHNVSQYEYANVQVPGGSPTWDQTIDLSVTVVDGTYQLSLSVGVRSNTGNTLIWDTITPEEHEEDGYYSYTATLKLINGNGNISDGFYLTCSNGYDLSSWTQNNRVFKEIYHSGQVRTWYFFVPPGTTSFPIELTP